MPSIEDIMIEDAREYLVPKLKKIVPVDSGLLKRSIDAGKYEGRNRREADDNNFHLVQRIIVHWKQNQYTVVAGALDRATSIYGHIQFQTNSAFRRKWIRVGREYEKEFAPRILKLILGGN